MIREQVVDKVKKLIMLATSPNESEARSAAFRAASLIREFNLDILDPLTRDDANAHASGSRDWPRWVYIISRYDGRCKSCGDSYSAGDRIQWKKNVGCVHEDCERI